MLLAVAVLTVSQDICHAGDQLKHLPQRSLTDVLSNAPLLHTRAACKGKKQDCSVSLAPQVSSVALACSPLLEARVVAWLGGPPGSGKSTLALRATQYGFLGAECEPAPAGGFEWLSRFGETDPISKRKLALANASSWLLHAATSGMLLGSCFGEWLPSSPEHVLRVLLLPEEDAYAERHKQRGPTGFATDGWRFASAHYRRSLRIWEQDKGASIVRVRDRPNETSCPDKSLMDACEGIMNFLKGAPDELCFYCRRARMPQSAFWLQHCPPNCLSVEGRDLEDARRRRQSEGSAVAADAGDKPSPLPRPAKVATPAEEEEIKTLLLNTAGGKLGRQAHNWRNPSVSSVTPFGYHSIQIGNLNLTGQRNPNERLSILRKFIDFKDKVVVDLGCNVGGMLHHLTEAKYAYGFDYDHRCVRAANRIAEIFHLPETFQQADLNTFRPNVTFPTLKHKPDIVFLFNIGSWVGHWPELYAAVAGSGVPLIVLETNNDIEGKPQLELFQRIGWKLQLLARAKDDVTGNLRRKTYLVTPA